MKMLDTSVVSRVLFKSKVRNHVTAPSVLLRVSGHEPTDPANVVEFFSFKVPGEPLEQSSGFFGFKNNSFISHYTLDTPVSTCIIRHTAREMLNNFESENTMNNNTITVGGQYRNEASGQIVTVTRVTATSVFFTYNDHPSTPWRRSIKTFNEVFQSFTSKKIEFPGTWMSRTI